MATTSVPVTRPATTTHSPPDLWRTLRTEMDGLFERMAGVIPGASTGGLMAAPFSGIWGFPTISGRFNDLARGGLPAVDLMEDEKSFTMTVEMPGLTEKDVKLSLDDDVLTVSGEKRQERDEQQKNWHLTERSYGEFRRSFVLPPSVNRDQIEASCKDGVLTIALPKAANAKPQTIPVKSAA